MASNPRKLRPGELCRLLNSTPLGEVISLAQLRTHRTRAGLRIGNDKQVDLVAYVAWLVERRHAPKSQNGNAEKSHVDLQQAAKGGAGIAVSSSQLRGHGQKLTHNQEKLIAALLTEATVAEAAAQVGISESSVYRYLNVPVFRDAYRQARQELVEAAIGRIQAASGQAVETLLEIARNGKRDSDRVRASVAILEQALKGLSEAGLLHRGAGEPDTTEISTDEVVQMLAQRLRELEAAELTTAEKSRLSGPLAQTLLKAMTVNLLDQRLAALSQVLLERKENT